MRLHEGILCVPEAAVALVELSEVKHGSGGVAAEAGAALGIRLVGLHRGGDVVACRNRAAGKRPSPPTPPPPPGSASSSLERLETKTPS